MYFIRRLQYEVLMHPETFGPNLKQYIHKRLRDDVEGSVHDTVGVIVAVIKFADDQDVLRGIIEYETGHASYVVDYEAIIYRPFKNEVLDAKVTLVHEHGFNAVAGFSNFTIFVTRHNMPGFSYKHEEERWEDDEDRGSVSRGSLIRLRVVNVEFGSKSEVRCVGTINGDYLGVLADGDADF
mmetsp:Transcript_30273/g.35730  ORF Transcript_30273/g.35730 Transcript_30273/m.35730 type:complete len:182 (-) Transcript_30273:209-754(-)